MKMHYSRFGYTARCGKRLSGTRWLTRTWVHVTCKNCERTHR